MSWSTLDRAVRERRHGAAWVPRPRGGDAAVPKDAGAAPRCLPVPGAGRLVAAATGVGSASVVRLLALVLLWAALPYALVWRLWWCSAALGAGVDLPPLMQAGAALLHGTDVYAVDRFVYPPGAALLGVPLWLAGPDAALTAVTALCLVAVAVAVAGPLRLVLPGTAWWWAAPPVVAALWTTPLAWWSAALANVSLPLAAVGWAVVLLWGRGRWTAGAWVLGLSFAVKPLLLGLLLVPLLARRPRAALTALAVAGAATLPALALVHDPGAPVRVVQHLMAGSELTGVNARLNVSLAGFAAAWGVPAPVAWAARGGAVAVVAVVAVVLLRRGPGTRPGTGAPDVACVAQVAALGHLALCLAGPLGEVHFVPVALPALVLASRRHGPAVAVGATAALLLLTWSPGFVDTTQFTVRLVAGQVLALGVVAVAAMRHASVPDAARHGRRPARRAASGDGSKGASAGG